MIIKALQNFHEVRGHRQQRAMAEQTKDVFLEEKIGQQRRRGEKISKEEGGRPSPKRTCNGVRDGEATESRTRCLKKSLGRVARTATERKGTGKECGLAPGVRFDSRGAKGSEASYLHSPRTALRDG